MRADAVEQVFVHRRAGRIELLVVLESPSGERQRETLLAPTASPLEAVGYAAVHLARRGIGPARRVRVRVDRGGALRDDPTLLEAFLRRLRSEGGDGPWP